MNSLRSALVEQFGKPSGLLGRVAGFIMRVRPSNRERNLRTLALLDIQPADQVLEVGFGPGLAIERAAELASRGKVVGIDHSALMLREARLRNAKAIADGRVELLLGSQIMFLISAPASTRSSRSTCSCSGTTPSPFSAAFFAS